MMNYSTEFNIDQDFDGAVAALMVQDHFIFIKRSSTMPSHAGQIGFVGGHKKDNEHSPLETVKREFAEELGLSSEILQIKGFSKSVNTTSQRKSIVPVVCEIKMELSSFLEAVQKNSEWDRLLAVPLSYLCNDINWVWGSLNSIGLHELRLYFCPLISFSYHSSSENTESELLWGATAQMVRNILFS